MYLHLSETTIQIILGTSLKNKSKIFCYLQYLAYLLLIFFICYQFLKTFLLRIFRFWPCLCISKFFFKSALTLSITLMEFLQILFCLAQNVSTA